MTDPFQIGLSLVEEFVTPDEEQAILASVPRPPPANAKERNSVFRWGVRHIYTNGFVSKHAPAPMQIVAVRLLSRGLLDAEPRCYTLNQYHAGNTIKAHIDEPKCGPVITVLSLLSSAVLRFHKDGEEIPVTLPPRSLVQMRGEIRSDWQHSVEPVVEERYSIVFRR